MFRSFRPSKSLYIGAFFIISFPFLIIAYCFSPLFSSRLDVIGFNDQRLVQSLAFALSIIPICFLGLWRYADFLASKISVFTLHCLFLGLMGALLTSLLAEYSARSFQDLSVYAGVFLSVVVIGFNLDKVGTEHAIKLYSKCILAIAVLYFTSFIGFYLANILGNGAPDFRSLPYFANVRTFNHFQILLIPQLHFTYVFCAKERLARNITLCLLVFYISLLFLTGARGALVSLCVTVITVAICIDKRVIYLSLVGKTFFLGFVFYLTFFVFAPSLIAAEGTDSISVLRAGSSGRIELWMFALSQSLACWPFGCGGQSFVVFTSQNYKVPFGTPHNIFLHLLVEYGVFTVFAFLVLIYRYVKAKRAMLKEKPSCFRVYLFTSLSTYLFYSLFSGVYVSTISLIFLPLLLVYLIHVRINQFSIMQPVSLYKKQLSFAVITFAILIFWCGFSVTLSDLFLLQDFSTSDTFFPRFWSNGAFFLKIPYES